MLFSSGCAHQPEPVPDESEQPLPFDRSSQTEGLTPTASLVPKEIPAGTPLTIRLQSAMASDTSHSGDSFNAVLDEPLIIQGQTVIPRGASASGKVLQAKSSDGLRDPGYLRVTLTSIVLNGKPLPLQTSVIFVKGVSPERSAPRISEAAEAGPSGNSGAHVLMHRVGASRLTSAGPASGQSGDVRFSLDHRFTFRVTQPVPVVG